MLALDNVKAAPVTGPVGFRFAARVVAHYRSMRSKRGTGGHLNVSKWRKIHARSGDIKIEGRIKLGVQRNLS